MAEHTGTGSPVAIKYLSAEVRSSDRDAFRAEARLLAGLDDPHLVRFHEYVESPEGAAIVMELVDGVTLRRLLTDAGAMVPEAALAVLKGSLLGLATAHRAGVVHRDYKPENVLVDEDGASKLADFGIAVHAGTQAPTAGTPSYMAPEQWDGALAGVPADIYAATAVFFECVTGRRPFMAATIAELATAHRTAAIPHEQVPEALRGLVQRGLAKNPADRPPSAEAFLAELEEAATAGYGSAWDDRGRRALAGLAAGLVALFPLALHTGTATTGVGAGSSGAGVGPAGVGAARTGLGTLKTFIAVAAGALIIGGATVVLAPRTGHGRPSPPPVARRVVRPTPTSPSPTTVSPSPTTVCPSATRLIDELHRQNLVGGRATNIRVTRLGCSGRYVAARGDSGAGVFGMIWRIDRDRLTNIYLGTQTLPCSDPAYRPVPKDLRSIVGCITG
jgi:hypothetical protein